jgi:RimJ/RimL family protein N-acetyltransferase
VSAVRVVLARPDDAAAISELECRPENRPFIRGHSKAEHRARMDDPTVRYLRIEDDAGTFIGFALVTQLGGHERSARLLRIVMDAPGRGLGRPAMEGVCELVFHEWGLDRFWLDVFEDNARARHVYESLGFRATGYAYQPRLPRGDGGAAPLMRMELLASERRST